jgi:hypothetical protein
VDANKLTPKDANDIILPNDVAWPARSPRADVKEINIMKNATAGEYLILLLRNDLK